MALPKHKSRIAPAERTKTLAERMAPFEGVPASSAEEHVETVTDMVRRDRVMASAERVMRKHQATFEALAK